MTRDKYEPADEGSSEFEPSVLTSWNGGTGYHTTGYGAMPGYAPLPRRNRRGASAWVAMAVRMLAACIKALRKVRP